MPEAYPKNAPGAFYVENECCVTCGIPVEVAPHIFSWDEEKGELDNHCFVRCQPKGQSDVDLVVEAMNKAEMDCIRYRGDDADVKAQLIREGLADQCD